MIRLVLFAVLLTWANVQTVLTEGTCILPPYPENGNYTVEQNPSAVPGQTVESYALHVTCYPGFQLIGKSLIGCTPGSYTDGLQTQCIPPCQWKSFTTVSCGVHENCYLQRSIIPVENETIVKARTNARFRDEHVCGDLDYVARPHIAGGSTSKKGEVPWHAGIYSKGYKPYKQICGGSLVSKTVVISAAHCFWNDVLKQLPAEDYAVALGKIYRPWNDPNDELAQKSDVKEIKIPPRFLGSASNFQEDLAVLVLATAITYTSVARPVCLHFDHKFDARQLTSGTLGKVAGWGLTSEDGRAAPILQIVRLPSISIEECVATTTPAFRAHLTGDKICAGYNNGTAVCKGDSGGGLTFLSDTPLGERYYLRGVVSAAPQSGHLCSVFSWATFTHLYKHQHFIQEVLDTQV